MGFIRFILATISVVLPTVAGVLMLYDLDLLHELLKPVRDISGMPAAQFSKDWWTMLAYSMISTGFTYLFANLFKLTTILKLTAFGKILTGIAALAVSYYLGEPYSNFKSDLLWITGVVDLPLGILNLLTVPKSSPKKSSKKTN